MGFSDNVVVKETSFQMLEVLSSDWIKITVQTFLVKKCNEAFRSVDVLRIRDKSLRQILSPNLKVSALFTHQHSPF